MDGGRILLSNRGPTFQSTNCKSKTYLKYDNFKVHLPKPNNPDVQTDSIKTFSATAVPRNHFLVDQDIHTKHTFLLSNQTIASDTGSGQA